MTSNVALEAIKTGYIKKKSLPTWERNVIVFGLNPENNLKFNFSDKFQVYALVLLAFS